MMKKILPTLLVGLLISSGLGAVALSDTYVKDNRIVFSQQDTIRVSDFSIQDNGEYQTVSIKEGSSLLLAPGQPMVPKVTKVYTYPLGTIITNIDIQIDTQEIKLEKLIQPAPQAVPLDQELASEILSQEPVFDSNVYESNELFPSSSYIIRKGAGLEDNKHVLYLKIDCFGQYAPAINTLYIPNTIDINVEYELPTVDLFSADEYDLVIITDESFTSDLQPLVDHKNSIGVRTTMETVQNILSSYNGRDDAEDVKLYIKDAIEDLGITYVLLAGGRKGQTFNWYVPSRRSNNDGSNWEPGYESDLYFADIYKIEENETVFEDWDSNENDVFAEWGNFMNSRDDMDYYPDVHVGRITLRYGFEVSQVVDKIIDYETNADDSWFKNGLVISGDTFPPSRGAPMDHVYEGEVETAVTADLLESIGFNMERLWLSLENWDSPEDIISAISQGHGFVHFAGHGNPASWGNHPADDADDVFYDGLTIFDMNKLKNENKLPVIVVGGCHNAQFNVTMAEIPVLIREYGIMGTFFEAPFRFFYMEWVPRSFCGWLVVQKSGGAIASIGNAGLGYGAIGEHGDLDSDNITEPDTIEAFGGWIETQFFEVYVNQGKTILGDAHDQAIIDYINQVGDVDSAPPEVDDINVDSTGRQTIEEWTLIGDPTLKIGGV